jgi:hypothetical protein
LIQFKIENISTIKVKKSFYYGHSISIAYTCSNRHFEPRCREEVQLLRDSMGETYLTEECYDQYDEWGPEWNKSFCDMAARQSAVAVYMKLGF